MAAHTTAILSEKLRRHACAPRSQSPSRAPGLSALRSPPDSLPCSLWSFGFWRPLTTPTAPPVNRGLQSVVECESCIPRNNRVRTDTRILARHARVSPEGLASRTFPRAHATWTELLTGTKGKKWSLALGSLSRALTRECNRASSGIPLVVRKS